MFSPGVGAAAPAIGMKVGSPQLTAMLDQIVTQQATMLAYLDDFKLMMYVVLAAFPLIFLLRKPASRQAPVPPPAD